MDWIAESELATRLGVSRALLREKRRALVKERDWRQDGATCLWSDPAVADLLQTLGIKKIAPPAAAEPGSCASIIDQVLAGPRPGDIRTLRVHKLVVNPHILLATDGKDVFRVRVKATDNFIKGMEIPCRHIQADLYELASHVPRRKGRW